MERKYQICHNEGCENTTRNPKYGKDKKHWIHYRDCHTCANLKTNYNITTPERDAMGDKVNWICTVCQTPMRRVPAGNKSRTKHDAVVDHCHYTGKIRGLICSTCNRGIGLLNDDIKTLERAMEYLKC
jgi:hypothetical protein